MRNVKQEQLSLEDEPFQHPDSLKLEMNQQQQIQNEPCLDENVDIVKYLESKFKQKLDLYEKLGKGCPSFASFEIACCENKGARLDPPLTYHVYNMIDLFNAWSENMNYLTKRKKSEKHWQAGLKKWLDGQWRKDKKPFDLTLKEPKLGEANQIRSLISQLFQVQDEIRNCIKAPIITHHHHHYYCKCGSPSVTQMDQLNLQLLSQGNSGEAHHHYIHYVEDNNFVNPEGSMEPPNIIPTKYKDSDPMEETENDANSASESHDEDIDPNQDIQTQNIQSHDHKKHEEKDQSNTFHIDWPWQDINFPEVQWPPQFEVNLPEVQWPPQLQFQWPPQFEVNLPQVQWPQITNSISNIFNPKDKKTN